MKTPDEIKKGLRGCEDKSQCRWCGLSRECEEDCDALAYIEQLEQRLSQVERERDAAVRDLAKAMSLDGVEDCEFCKHSKKPYCHPCKWEWRGICPENTKEE